MREHLVWLYITGYVTLILCLVFLVIAIMIGRPDVHDLDDDLDG